jgi:NADP-reducing hydrogenase subunit HndC
MKFTRSMVLVSNDPESLRRGASEIYQSFQDELTAADLSEQVALSHIPDSGRPDILPMVIIYPEASVYGPVKPADVKRIVEEHLINGIVVQDLLAPVRELTGRVSWLKARKDTQPMEKRIVLRRAGRIDPESIEDFIAEDGYQALAKAIGMTRMEVIAELDSSGLQGRGGAGFPTGLKWRFVAGTKSTKKYVVCNADESEPGTFKDRVILEGDPHSLLEAIAIAAYAVGANEGYIYVRGEYQLVQQRLQKAITQAREYGLLGKNILGSGFSFDLHVHSGAGAYVCGEETALLESIEGKRGQPRSRPPYPTTHGLWGKPTLINNVETLANVPAIILNGAEWYRSIGTPSSPGTKVYTILGNVNFTGLIEVPMGITLREVISIYGQGMKDGASFKLAQTGGSSGSVFPPSLQDTPLDFESFKKAGVSLGSGALLVCDERTCVVDLALTQLKFFQAESCGKCTPCRVGTERAVRILTSISAGQAQLGDLDILLNLADEMDLASNCGLGQAASVPIRDILKNFRAEVEAHIRLGVCPAGVCAMAPEEDLELVKQG